MRSLYWHIGKRNFGPNAVNIGAALFMWTILPGFAAAAYTPTLVQERPIFYRCIQPLTCFSIPCPFLILQRRPHIAKRL
jgi:hypothetical protein